MINYKLSVYTDDKTYNPLDLAVCFNKKKDSYNLEKLDEFTMLFNSEEELKSYLNAKGILSKDDMSKPLKIFYGQKNLRNIPIIYSDSKEQIKNISKLSSNILRYFNRQKNRARSTFSYDQMLGDYTDITSYFDVFAKMSKSKKFLRKLQEYCKNNPVQGLNINDLGVYISDSYVYTKDTLLYIALFELFRRIFYKYNYESKNLEFNYKGFRDFSIFYCNYRNEELKKKNIDISKDKVKDEIKKEETWEQTSFFDESYQKKLK